MANVMIANGIQEYIRSKNEPEFIANDLRNGYPVLVSKPLTLNLAVLGRMAFVKALKATSEITFWMGRSSAVLKKTRSARGSRLSITTMSGRIELTASQNQVLEIIQNQTILLQ